MLRFLQVSFLFLFTSFILQAQILTPVKWSFDTEALGNDEYNLVYTATIDKGWTVYSQFTNDEGPVPTSIDYDNSEIIEKIGKANESGKKKEGFDKIFELDVIKFLSDEPFVIKQKIKVKDYSKPLEGYLTFMTCDKSKCLPPTDVDFSFSFKKAKGKPAPSGTASTDSKTSNINRKDQVKIPEKIKQVKKEVQAVTPTAKNAKSAIKEVASSGTAAAVRKKAAAEEADLKNTEKLNNSSSSSVKSNDQVSTSNPVVWNFSVEDLGNEEYNLVYTADIHPEWNAYSMFTNDDGPVPTYIEYESEGIELIGKPVETGDRKEGPDPLFDNVNVIKFYGGTPFVIKQKVKVEDSSASVLGYLEYMACDKAHCLPPQPIDFEFVPATGMAKERSIAGDIASGVLAISENLDGDYIDQEVATLRETYETPLGDCGTVEERSGLHWSFLFGFLGGLLALLTPCVFPMIPLTVSFFTKDTKRKGWVNGVLYGLSIIVIYVALGLMITAFFGDEALNRLSTNWIANTAFFVIFIFFAFSFFGFYEIQLPSSWTNKSDTMADKGGLIGIFFMAFTLALVSFSCTGPIIGTAIVSSATSKLGPFIVMLGFSIALALPFGIFAAIPALLNSLPKSGSWMTSVKVVLGFLELALAFKFLSVADMTNHWGFLRYELFMGLWVVIFAGMTLYLFGFIKFPHDSPIKKLSPVRWAFAIASLALTGYLATGFIYSDTIKSYESKALMSGISPPSNYNFFLAEPDVDPEMKKRFPSFSKCANNIDCFKDYYEGMSYAREINKPALIDMTGHGCVNCRKTEEHIWVRDNIRHKLNNDFVLISLYVDDDKKLDRTYISKTRQKKLRNVGNKWADFQIINFEQNSQPLYIMVTPEEEVIAAPRGYESGADEYYKYLECGLNTYEKVKGPLGHLMK